MGLVTFFGAKGSPGVTTTALLAAALWPRPAVLVDADPDGGDVALRLPRADGAPLDRSLGLLTLLPLARRELAAHVVREHSQTVLGGVEVVAGLAGPEQANAVGPLWGSLAGALTRCRTPTWSSTPAGCTRSRCTSRSRRLPTWSCACCG